MHTDAEHTTLTNQVYPVSYMNLNYAPIAVGLTLVIATTWWCLGPWAAAKWFKGPKGGWGNEDAGSFNGIEEASKDVDVAAS